MAAQLETSILPVEKHASKTAPSFACDYGAKQPQPIVQEEHHRHFKTKVQPNSLVRLIDDNLVLASGSGIAASVDLLFKGTFLDWAQYTIFRRGWGREFAGGRLGGGNGSPLFFIQAYWDLETTKTTFKNNIILRTYLEHSES